MRKQSEALIFWTFNLSPTTRKGNVFRSVRHSVQGGQADLPMEEDPPLREGSCNMTGSDIVHPLSTTGADI